MKRGLATSPNHVSCNVMRSTIGMCTRKRTHTHTHTHTHTFIGCWNDKCVYFLHFLCDLLIDVPDTTRAVTVQGATLVVMLPVRLSLGLTICYSLLSV